MSVINGVFPPQFALAAFLHVLNNHLVLLKALHKSSKFSKSQFHLLKGLNISGYSRYDYTDTNLFSKTLNFIFAVIITLTTTKRKLQG